jgi:replicative DNA helicase
MREVRRYLTIEQEHQYIPTGIPKLDRTIGGFTQELVFVFADAGAGKTTLLINLGKAAALVGFNVLHISLELFPEPLLRRYYRCVTESDRKLLRTDIELVATRAEHWVRMAKGKVHVLYQQAYTLTPEKLQILVEQYVQLHGPVHVIIVDYIDLMEPSATVRGKSTADQLAHTSHSLRALCPIFGACVITPTQSVRSASGAVRLRMSDVASSYGIPRAADVLLGYVQTEEEYQMNQARLALLKLRESAGKGTEIPLYVNQDLMMIADLDHPNTVRVMKMLGHIPGAPAAVPTAQPAAV